MRENITPKRFECTWQRRGDGQPLGMEWRESDRRIEWEVVEPLPDGPTKCLAYVLVTAICIGLGLLTLGLIWVVNR